MAPSTSSATSEATYRYDHTRCKGQPSGLIRRLPSPPSPRASRQADAMRLGTTVLRTCTEPVALESVMKMRCSKVSQTNLDVAAARCFCIAQKLVPTGLGDRKLFRKLLHCRCTLAGCTASPSVCAHQWLLWRALQARPARKSIFRIAPLTIL